MKIISFYTPHNVNQQLSGYMRVEKNFIFTVCLRRNVICDNENPFVYDVLGRTNDKTLHSAAAYYGLCEIFQDAKTF